MADNTFDVNGGSNQILPNAQEGKQYFIGDSAIKQAMQHAKGEALQAEILDMTSYSGTFPEKVEHELLREVHLSLCEEKLKDNKVVCVTGEEELV